MKHTATTLKAQEKLMNLSGYPVEIVTMKEFAISSGLLNVESYLGVHYFDGEQHIIGVNSEKPETNESTFVHECIHAILDIEGFPKVKIDYKGSEDITINKNCDLLAAFLSSAIQHPEVYRRMDKEFNIDMRNYFQGLLIQKKSRLTKKDSVSQGGLDAVLSNQQDIIDGFEYFFYSENEQKEILDLFKKVSPSAFDFLQGIRKKSKLDFYSPSKARVSALDFFERIKKYGEKKAGQSLNTMFWDKISIE
ncbi:hypothetical protein [Pontibacter fetidus]|uniref:IrrE N-terminal-like domain-containing protein n=1 Tax=Pontibacter fetidus TaxID=2700082 RepID=A0A6B2H3A2_9BACT|nr:hypothetical protein [Pontibacter fetidus]NDK56823.1 hypothetical protein [Pontibacter fetidus]